MKHAILHILNTVLHPNFPLFHFLSNSNRTRIHSEPNSNRNRTELFSNFLPNYLHKFENSSVRIPFRDGFESGKNIKSGKFGRRTVEKKIKKNNTKSRVEKKMHTHRNINDACFTLPVFIQFSVLIYLTCKTFEKGLKKKFFFKLNFAYHSYVRSFFDI